MFHFTNQDNRQALRLLWRDNLNQAFEDYAMTAHASLERTTHVVLTGHLNVPLYTIKTVLEKTSMM